MSTYTNLDGTRVETDKFIDRYIEAIKQHGYPHEVKVRGQLQGSELEMFTGNVGRTAIVAWTNQQGNYAYCLLDNGKLLDGCFHQFADGSVCLS